MILTRDNAKIVATCLRASLEFKKVYDKHKLTRPMYHRDFPVEKQFVSEQRNGSILIVCGVTKDQEIHSSLSEMERFYGINSFQKTL